MNLSQARDSINLLYGSPLTVLSDCLRGFLIASPGHRFIGADFSAIESRALNWLAGEEKVLAIYRSHGKIYEHNAAGIYGVPIEKVTKDQRQIGKVAELALGYQGGKVAFHSMAKNYGVKVSDTEAERIKVGWRSEHPHVVRYWYALEEAARSAILHPGQKFKAGAKGREATFLVKGSFLWCRLPSGRCLSYPYPSLKTAETPWGEPKEIIHYKTLNTNGSKFGDEKTYGGSLCENITQAVARDLLAEAMVRLEAKGYPIVLHVHDEIVADVPEAFGSVEEFEEIMAELPVWAKGLPLAAEGFEGKRYRK